MNDALLLLETNIARLFSGTFRSPEAWTTQSGMDKALQSVRTAFDNPVSRPGDRRVADAVAAFHKTRRIPNFLALKYICLGAGEINSQGCVLGDPELRELLFFRAGEGTLRAQMKCFQCLLRSYFTFARDDEEAPATACEGWVAVHAIYFSP